MKIGKREILKLKQGTPEWHKERLRSCTASEAPRMMGVLKFGTRSGLMALKKTGEDPESGEGGFMDKIYAKGHRLEDLARKYVEDAILQSELYPVTVAREVDGIRLLASCDGLDLIEQTAFEHKQWNTDLALQVEMRELDEMYKWQLDQILLVTGAEMVVFAVSDLEDWDGASVPEKFTSMIYRTTPERLEKLMAGWKQFLSDLCHFVSKESISLPEGKAPDALPMLKIEVQGMVKASNIDQFKQQAVAVIDSIKTDLTTDQDFADADKAAKWCKRVETQLKEAKRRALAQTEEIDALFRAIDEVSEMARQRRLSLEKLVKQEKSKRKDELIQEAITETLQFLDQKNAEAFKAMDAEPMSDIPITLEDVGGRERFAAAIHGLKTLDSVREKLSVAVSHAKIEGAAVADNLITNAASVTDWSLFPDFFTVGKRSHQDFLALDALREKQVAEERAKAETSRQQAATPQAEPEKAAERPAQAADDSLQKENEEVDKQLIEDYIKSAGLAPRTAVTVRKHLVAFLEFTAQQGIKLSQF